MGVEAVERVREVCVSVCVLLHYSFSVLHMCLSVTRRSGGVQFTPIPHISSSAHTHLLVGVSRARSCVPKQPLEINMHSFCIPIDVFPSPLFCCSIAVLAGTCTTNVPCVFL